MKPPNHVQDSEKPSSSSQILNLFWDLQSKDLNARLIASKKLTQTIQEQQSHMVGDEVSSDLEYTFSRLIQGLGSDRKQVKIGFSTALTNLLSNVPSSVMNGKRFLYLINDQLSITSKQSSKKILQEVYVGRLFCFLSLIKSNKLTEDDDYESVNVTVESLLSLSRKKPNLKKLAYHAILELIRQADQICFDNALWTPLFPLFKAGWSDSSIQLVNLLLICHKNHPKTCGKNFLLTFNWISSSNSPIIHKKNFGNLAQLVGKSTVSHPVIDTSVLDVFDHMFDLKSDIFIDFWVNSLQEELLSGSAEKKYLAFHLAIYFIPFLSAQNVALVWSKDLISYFHHALLNKNSSIHHLCKQSLTKALVKRIKEDVVLADVQYALLMQLYVSFPDTSGNNTLYSQFIDSLVQHLKLEALMKYIEWLKSAFTNGYLFNATQSNADEVRKWSIIQLAQLIKETNLPRLENWVADVLKFLFRNAYCSVELSKKRSSEKDIESFVDTSDVVRNQAVLSFTSTLSLLSHSKQFPVKEQDDDIPENSSHFGQMSSGDFWTTYLLKYAHSLSSLKSVSLLLIGDETQEVWNSAMKHMKKLITLKRSQSDVDMRILELLLTNLMFQLFSDQEFVRKATIDVINDLQVIISKSDKKNTKISTDDSPHWSQVIMEIMLSLLLTESSLMHCVVKQAFRMLCPHMTKETFDMILDVLEAKEDKKLLVVQDDEQSTDDETDDDSDEGSSSDQDVDEMFKSEVRQALGNAAIDVSNGIADEGSNDEDLSDEDLSDEAMMKLDPMLSDIFKRKKKLDAQATKKQLVEFQTHCLMLIEIFLSRPYDSISLIVDLPLPLLRIIEKAATDSRKAIVAERATVILRAKLCRMKTLPSNLDTASVASCFENIKTLLLMARKGSRGLFIHKLISQCCLFFLKIITKQESFDSEFVCQLYSTVMNDFMTRRQSKVQHFILSDFVRSYPLISQNLAPDLIQYCANAVQPYRRLQACLLLSTLCYSKNSMQHLVSLSKTILASVKKALRKITADDKDVNSKYLKELLKLFHFSVKAQLSKSEEKSLSKVVNILQDLLSVSVVNRSSSLTNHVWKILQLLNVTRSAKVHQRSEKPKLNSDKKEKNKESSRQLKQRIMKQKKEGAGKKLKNTVIENMDTSQ